MPAPSLPLLGRSVPNLVVDSTMVSAVFFRWDQHVTGDRDRVGWIKTASSDKFVNQILPRSVITPIAIRHDPIPKLSSNR
jgi:hypothetical protein